MDALGTAPEHAAQCHPLRKYLEHHLAVAECRGRLHCHVLSDAYRWEDLQHEPIGPRRGHCEYLQTRHTILIYMSTGSAAAAAAGKPSPNTSPAKRRTCENVLVFGMTMWEYAHQARPAVPSRAYIQHVDTTGLYRPRRQQGTLTRAVVAAYVRYCRDVAKIPFLHLFASSQPSLLYAGSEMLPKKRVLDGARLVTWWVALVHSTLAPPSDAPAFVQRHSRPPLCFLHSVAEDSMPVFVQSLRSLVPLLNRTSASAGGAMWQYGYPYFSADAQDAATLPLFEDDPKWRHYEAALDGDGDRPVKRQRKNSDAVSVHDFFQTMAYRHEFSQNPSAFIVVHFPENAPAPQSQSPAQSSSLASSSPAPQPPKRTDLSAFVAKLLKTLHFHTEPEAAKSSMRIWSWLKLMGSAPFEISVDAESVDAAHSVRFRDTVAQISRPDPAAAATPTAATTAPFQDVQTLIRRKVPRS